jgi:hypothetical protein
MESESSLQYLHKPCHISVSRSNVSYVQLKGGDMVCFLGGRHWTTKYNFDMFVLQMPQQSKSGRGQYKPCAGRNQFGSTPNASANLDSNYMGATSLRRLSFNLGPKCSVGMIRINGDIPSETCGLHIDGTRSKKGVHITSIT